jgi:hypothetical protein
MVEYFSKGLLKASSESRENVSHDARVLSGRFRIGSEAGLFSAAGTPILQVMVSDSVLVR